MNAILRPPLTVCEDFWMKELRESMKDTPMPFMVSRVRSTLLVVVPAALVYFLLIWITSLWPDLLTTVGRPTYHSFPPEAGTQTTATSYPFYELTKLMVAALLGTIVTQVHKYYHREKLLSRSLEQAQILLCVSGAMMMVIIGDSLARAFGIAGAAAIIRFRTPVEDPKDITLLFLVLGVGMACGLGAFSVAGLASFFLCFLLSLLDHIGEQKPKAMLLELTASGSEFPTSHVQNIFAAYGSIYEIREMTHGEEAMVKYQVTLVPNTPLDCMSDQLLSGGFSGLKSVVWQNPKKNG
jgi:hypothetical protein